LSQCPAFGVWWHSPAAQLSSVQSTPSWQSFAEQQEPQVAVVRSALWQQSSSPEQSGTREHWPRVQMSSVQGSSSSHWELTQHSPQPNSSQHSTPICVSHEACSQRPELQLSSVHRLASSHSSGVPFGQGSL
jgi:hypothetical protein